MVKRSAVEEGTGVAEIASGVFAKGEHGVEGNVNAALHRQQRWNESTLLLLLFCAQTRVERKSAKDKVHVVQEALTSFKNLFDAGLIDATEHEKRRAQLLDKVLLGCCAWSALTLFGVADANVDSWLTLTRRATSLLLLRVVPPLTLMV